VIVANGLRLAARETVSMRLIVTRPEPDDQRTARALIRLGHEAILSPMLDVVIDPKAKIKRAPYQAVLVTSSNAVRALAARSDEVVDRKLPLIAVGDQTALAAKRAANGIPPTDRSFTRPARRGKAMFRAASESSASKWRSPCSIARSDAHDYRGSPRLR
jgi:uroporphyrinogen-III synthase